MNNKEQKFHFIAIGGVGMSGLAKYLLKLGFSVSGSDIKESKYTKKVQELGATVYIGHSAEYVKPDTIVVASTAIRDENPEIVKENIVPMISELVVGLNATEEAFTKFIQAYLYSLDGTMESKEKIVSILGDLKLSDTTTVNSLKEWISGELAKIKEENDKKVRLLKELGEMNDKAKSESVILNDSDENKDIRF